MSLPSGFPISPRDQHNELLVSHVHPPDWVNPKPQGRYNLVVVGAGTAGLVTAIGAAGLGAKVALVERHLLGGECLTVGCVPSKGLLAAAKTVATVSKAGKYGIRVPGQATVDFPAVMERMRRLRAGISRHDSARRYSEAGVDVFIGQGEFIDGHQLRVEDQVLHFKRAVIATGARAAGIPIPGLEEAGYLTNETVFSLTKLPARLGVIGAGPIGCEMAQAFRRFGSEVHLLERARQILSREDRDAAAIVEAALLEDGVNLVLDCSTRSVSAVSAAGGEKIIEVECGGESRRIALDEILVGVGRAPHVEGLGLESAGVEYDKRKGVLVNDYLQTSNPMIYAAGDICNLYKFTHTADATARIVIQNALFFGRKKASSLTIPWCTYTDPEIAHVGMYEKDAAEKGLEVETFVRELKDVDRAVLDGETAGFVKVHVERGSDRILGATIVARNGGSMISELTLAMVAGAGLGTVAGTIHPYPTQAEAIKQVGDAYNRTRLTPFVKSLFNRWLAWTR